LFLDWFFDEDANRPFYWNNGRQQGVFMIRVNANRFDGSKETSTPITYAPEWTKVRSASFTDITNYAETETKTTAEVELVRSAGSKGLVVAPECPEPPQKAPFTFTGDYQLWRFTQGQPQANWYLINNNHTTESYTDNAWSDLPSGVYRYAVTARYAGGLLSQPSISNSLALNMEFDFRINISSNSEKPVTGAIVTLTSQELNSNGSAPLNTYRVVSGADGVTIPKAWVGVYDLTVTFGGHVNYSAQNININGPGLSHTAQLIEIIVNPMALEVDVNWPARSALLMWNRFEGFFDDMEDHADFARDNAIGDYTVYNFNPTQTYGLNTSWPGIYEPQAYMVWNPWGIGSMGWTLAGETDFFNPRPNGGGRKALASFGPVDYGRKDYWLVLPRVRTTHGVKFSFWARNVYPGSCTETLRIMISTTGKQVNDFQRLPGTTDVVIAEPWTKYSFDIPEEFARKDVYLAIQNMSTCGVLLLLDDISVDIDRGTSSKSVQNYTVYLNGNEVTTTANTEHLFSGLAEGTHTAGVKANYASGVSQTTTITFRMDENTNIAVLSEEIFTVYPNPVTDVLHIQTNEIITQIVVLDVNGRVMQTLQGNQKSVNLQALPVGNYIVRIHTATSVTPVKIVKQ
jgi:hypothetical protein